MAFKKLTNLELMQRGKQARLGHTFINDSNVSFDVRCPLCGTWVRYDYKEKERMIREGRWDFDKDRMAHCGNSLCEDYLHLCQVDKERKMKGLFVDLKNKGLVA